MSNQTVRNSFITAKSAGWGNPKSAGASGSRYNPSGITNMMTNAHVSEITAGVSNLMTWDICNEYLGLPNADAKPYPRMVFKEGRELQSTLDPLTPVTGSTPGPTSFEISTDGTYSIEGQICCRWMTNDTTGAVKVTINCISGTETLFTRERQFIKNNEWITIPFNWTGFLNNNILHYVNLTVSATQSPFGSAKIELKKWTAGSGGRYLPPTKDALGDCYLTFTKL